jgi:hypothetical protein
MDWCRDWSAQLLDEPRERISEAEVELELARSGLEALRTKLTEQRRRIVLDRIDPKELVATRRKIGEQETVIADLEHGLLEARRQSNQSPGQPAAEVAQRLRKTCAVVRDQRGSIFGAIETDRLPSSAMANQCMAEISSASAKLDEIEAIVTAVSGAVPDDLAATMKSLRKTLGLIRGELPMSSRRAA